MGAEDELAAAKRLIAQEHVARRRREQFTCVVCGTVFDAAYRKPPSTPRYCKNACKVKAWQRARKAKPSTRISLVSRVQPGK